MQRIEPVLLFRFCFFFLFSFVSNDRYCCWDQVEPLLLLWNVLSRRGAESTSPFLTAPPLCLVVQVPPRPSRTLGTDRMEAARQSPARPWLKREVGERESAAGVTHVRRSVAAALSWMSARWCVTRFQETLISVHNAAVSLFAVCHA